MAATLTESGELTFATFPIEKVESTPDGDLMVFGRASDGGLDHDQQIVDPQFSSKAIRDWLATGGNIRVQHNAQRDPAGVGIEVNTDEHGATWVKGLIIEPVAKRLVSKGALRAYSVGIARPTIVRDSVAKGGRITAGEVVEISIVDRPANARCGISLVKSAADGTPEYIGQVFGSDDDIAKALDGEIVEKSAPAEAPEAARFGFAEDLSVSITPDDVMRLMQNKFVSRHYDELAVKAVAEAENMLLGKDHREFSADERRHQAGQGNALPDGSYPIPDGDALDRAAILARSGHGNVAAARRLIARRARELGVANPLDESDEVKKVSGDEATMTVAEAVAEASEAVKEAEPDVTKDPEPEPKDKPVKKAKKKPKKLPPWLNKPSDDDGDSDDDDKADKAAHCGQDHEHTEKCHTDPAQAAGVSASPMQPAPVGDLLETPPPASVSKGGPTPASASGAVAESMQPVPAHREPDGAPAEAFEKDAKLSDGDSEAPAKVEAATGMKAMPGEPEVAVLLRFKALGVDEDLGRLHDLTCPAFHPEDVAKYHPLADLPSLIDSGAWQRKTLHAAAGPLDAALKMQEVWQAALLLKTADMADLNDWRLELHKAFRDANPGPGSYPTPGHVSPGSYNRPVLTDGRAACAVDHDGPNSAPQVATSAPNAHSFDRPPLSSGQQSPSPSFMKGDGEYPSEQGVPTQLTYAQMQKEHSRMALVRMHEHLSRQFPEVCPLNTVNEQGVEGRPLRGVQPEHHPVPATAGIGKAIDPEPAAVAPAAPVTAAFKATPEGDGDFFSDADVYKSFKKMRKKLGKKVLSGSMTVDEARAKLGRQFAQKGAELLEPAPDVQKSATIAVNTVTSTVPGAQVTYNTSTVPAAIDPDVIKSAVVEATSELKDLLVQQQETFTTKLAEQQRVIDAIADQPDPSTAAFSGLAFQPVQKARRPAAVPDQAEYAARAQEMVRRNLQNTYQTHSNPSVREAAGEALARFGVEAAPMT